MQPIRKQRAWHALEVSFFVHVAGGTQFAIMRADSAAAWVSGMSNRILIAETFYDDYLQDYYSRNPSVAELPYAEQLAHLLAERFSSGDSYVSGLRAQGWDADMVVLNARPLQRRWAHEQGLAIADPEREQGGSVKRKWDSEIFIAQVRALHPDVLYLQELSVARDDVIEAAKPFTRLVVGQIACSIPPGRTFHYHDLMLSSFEPIVEYFRASGKASELFRLAFDSAALPHVCNEPQRYQVTFVGGLSPVHEERIALLEHLCQNVPIDIFGYGAETLPDHSPIHEHHRGAAWGTDAYRAMAASAITINCHGTIAVPGYPNMDFANNSRLFEATGVGTMLLTDWKNDLDDIFTSGKEVAAYKCPDECLEKIGYFLAHGDERRTIARAGQRRTLKEHTYSNRMQWLSDRLGDHL